LRGAELDVLYVASTSEPMSEKLAGVRDLEKTVRQVIGDDDSVPVHHLMVEGPAAQALLEAAKRADLLVVGSHGHRGYGGLRLGSVSQQVADHAPCPVVVVR
ncbi:MAG TPA: universal stress protein, partial [Acidimicrobiia bacterium]|nr:universal stress protein [Acidimicrobiia bacterium]